MRRPALTHALIAVGLTTAVAVPVARQSSPEPAPRVVAEAGTSIRPIELPQNMDVAGMAAGRALAAQKAAAARAAKEKALLEAAKERRERAARRASRERRMAPVSSGSARAIAQSMLAQRGWSDQWSCLDRLWQKESGWRVTASNPSGAYGIPQALPGSKMASAGDDWRTNAATQIRWGLGYIGDRYGGPCAAWSHSQSTGWY